MPKVTFYKKPAPKPVKRDHIIELFNVYRKARRIPRSKLAERLNCCPSYVSIKLSKGSDVYTLGDFKDWVNALDIPPKDAADAVYAYLTEGSK